MFTRVDRMGMPAISTALIGSAEKNNYNDDSPADDVIPYRHGQELFRAANEPKRFLKIRGGHNEGFMLSGQTYVDGLDAFLTAHLGQAD